MFGSSGRSREKKQSESARRARQAPARRVSKFELLEMREMLSASPSPTTPDGAPNSLRDLIAVFNASTSAAPFVIKLAPDSTGAYTLGSSGELDVTNTVSPLIIEGTGSGADMSVIAGTVDRVLQVVPGATVILENLEITHGDATTDSSGGTTAAEGGGILNEGSLTLNAVTVSGNTAVAPAAGFNAYGGGVFNNGGALTIEGGSVITGNTASGGAGGNAFGGGVYSENGPVVIKDSQITTGNAAIGGSGNGAPGGAPGLADGGGVLITSASSATLDDDTISGNSATGGRGATGAAGANGGAGATGSGGGIYLFGPGQITNTTINGNTASGGLGGLPGTGAGTQEGNGGEADGGGVLADGPAKLVNDTIEGNTAQGANSGDSSLASTSLGGKAFGGGIDDLSTGMKIVNATIANNIAMGGKGGASALATSSGGGIANGPVGTSDPKLQVVNTLLVTNHALAGPDFFGAANSTDSNLIDDLGGATGFGLSQFNTLAGIGLGPLQNNGGSVSTMSLPAGSPALGTGDPDAATVALTAAGFSSPLTDERGLPRIVGGLIDVGAFETQFALMGPTVASATTTIGKPATALVISTPDTTGPTGLPIQFFQITGITGGTLATSTGTAIVNGGFITVAQATAGLTFTPTATGTGGFKVQESTNKDANGDGLGGPTATSTITTNFTGATVSPATTTAGLLTTSGLVITPNSADFGNDSDADFAQITNIPPASAGTLYFKIAGIPPLAVAIANGSFVPLLPTGEQLFFQPAAGFVGVATFSVQESTTASATGLSGPIATGTVNVGLAGATVAPVQTPENVTVTVPITPSNAAAVKSFQITNIVDGTLADSIGTAIVNGQFITVAQGAGLKFTPQTGFVGIAGFSVAESSTSDAIGLNGPGATASITVVGPPTALSATPSTPGVLPPAITLSWTAPPVPVSSYIVLRGTASSGPFAQIGTTTGTTTGFTDNSTTDPPGGVVPNTTYFYEVEAVSGTATSPPSGIAFATVTAPTPPGNVAASVLGNNVTLTWTLSSDASAKYFIFRGTTAGGESSTPVGMTPVGATSFQDIGLAPGTYFYVVKAEDGPESSVASNEASATVAAAIGAPNVTGASGSQGVQTTSGLVITPSSAAVTNFQITGITGGTLYLNDGVTVISNGTFISVAQGGAGLKFTPNSTNNGSFTVQQSTSASLAGLSGFTASALITVSGFGPGGQTSHGTASPVLNLPYNQEGITTDGTQVLNGGIDGAGNTLSANALGSGSWLTTNTDTSATVPTGGFLAGGFAFGAPNSANIVAATGQTVFLSSAQQATSFDEVQLLAIGVNGNQAGLFVTINYSDNTSSTVPLSFSDWFTPQNFSLESIAVSLSHRNTANGGQDSRTFNAYAYTVPVDPSKSVVSITLPNSSPNDNVKVLAVDMVNT
jgi:hypothetical protein